MGKALCCDFVPSPTLAEHRGMRWQGTPRVNVDLSGKLVKRYREEVKASEAGRKQVFVPLDGAGSTLDKQDYSRTKDRIHHERLLTPLQLWCKRILTE
eukprot:3595166-Amphidinium_carterae.1